MSGGTAKKIKDSKALAVVAYSEDGIGTFANFY